MYLLHTTYTNVIDRSVGPACGVSPAPGWVTWPLLPSRSISVTCLCSSPFSQVTRLWALEQDLPHLLDKSWGLQARQGELYCMTHHKQYKHEFLKWNENNELKSHIYCNILRASMHFSICAMCHEPSLLIYRRELGLISRKYYRLWLHPVFSVVGSECGVPITKRRYSFYKQSLYGGDQFVIMAVITKNNTVNTRIHLYRQPATETWRWIKTHYSRAGKPQFISINVILTMVSDIISIGETGLGRCVLYISKVISDHQHVNVVMVSSDGGSSGSSPGTCFRILLVWAGLGWTTGLAGPGCSDRVF